MCEIACSLRYCKLYTISRILFPLMEILSAAQNYSQRLCRLKIRHRNVNETARHFVCNTAVRSCTNRSRKRRKSKVAARVENARERRKWTWSWPRTLQFPRTERETQRERERERSVRRSCARLIEISVGSGQDDGCGRREWKRNETKLSSRPCGQQMWVREIEAGKSRIVEPCPISLVPALSFSIRTYSLYHCTYTSSCGAFTFVRVRESFRRSTNSMLWVRVASKNWAYELAWRNKYTARKSWGIFQNECEATRGKKHLIFFFPLNKNNFHSLVVCWRSCLNSCLLVTGCADRNEWPNSYTMIRLLFEFIGISVYWIEITEV